MIRHVTAIEYNRPATSGRTLPSFITCELENGEAVEVVAKFSAGFDQGVINLAREVIGACLAADLGLPVPEPFLVHIPPDWIVTVPDAAVRQKIERSANVAFGSRVLTGQFGIWTPGHIITDVMLPMAAAIFAFDAITQNPDRRETNPNCLVRGDELRIFDHEMAFAHGLVLFWKPPWQVGGLQGMEVNEQHIFRRGLRGRIIDFEPIRNAWASVSNDMIGDYVAALPLQWHGAGTEVDRAAALIRDARDNMDSCLQEIRRVLE